MDRIQIIESKTYVYISTLTNMHTHVLPLRHTLKQEEEEKVEEKNEEEEEEQQQQQQQQ